jgi:hypothetical protein
MSERLATFIVGEGNWMPIAIGLAFIATAALLFSLRDTATSLKSRILAVMNLFTGVMLFIMGFGHLLAVTVKIAQGTLVRGSPWLFYPIGLAIVVPAWFVIRNTRAIVAAEAVRSTVRLNAWLAVTLLVLGVVNLPLAIPAFCSIGYSLNTRRWVGWLIVAAMTITCVGLFIGSVLFMASGRSFEEFSAMP